MPPASPDGADLVKWIREHTPQLLGVARAFADGADEAEDLLQELWIQADRRMDRRPANAPLRAWLHMILLNIGRARWRRRRRRERLMALWGERTEPMTESIDAGDETEMRGELWRNIAALPELQRRVLLLRVVEELSTADAAAMLNRAEGTIKASLHRALKTLREKSAVAPPDVRNNEWYHLEVRDGE